MTMTATDATADLAELSADELASIDAWWRAANYLTVGQIYLGSNPLLRTPLTADDIKPRLLGHWGTSPGLSFIYAHTSRLIKKTGQSVIYMAGPGHGGPALVAASWLEGTYTEDFPEITQDAEGMRKLFRQFSAPGGIPSHASVTTPGSIHEGGELGYVLVHAFGSVMDNPDLLTIAVVGDGEAETAALEGGWKGVSFINPVHDGAVLPILHLNNAKISGPTVLGRKDPELVRRLFEGHGYDVLEVSGSDVPGMHERFAATLTQAWKSIKQIQESARSGSWNGQEPKWPMIVLRTPKGWTGPDKVDGVQIQGTFRAHQVPLSGVKTDPAHLQILEDWMRSYKIDELFDSNGRPTELVRSACPEGDLRISGNPVANGGMLTVDLDMPDIDDYAREVPKPATVREESTRALGEFMRELYRRNPKNFRLFCPDETNSNRLGAVFDVSDRGFMEPTTADDVSLSNNGRVMEVLSENSCQGWLEGYTLSGRHGLFATYEAFAMVSASQTIQHSKWLEEARNLKWRVPVPSLNILLTSTAWRNDHNGFSHQGPGLLNVAQTARADVARIYLPPDANCLLSVAEHCFKSRNYVNFIVIDKQPQLQWLTMAEAKEHCRVGASVWDWAGNNDEDGEPDIVLASAGDVVTLEVIAAAQILKDALPELKIRVVNVVDLMTLHRRKDHPHGMDELLFRELFTDTTDVVFAFHGYPGAIHSLIHGRPNPDRFRARGFLEEGTTTTPFDMVVKNKVSRFHLVLDALNNAKRTVSGSEVLREFCLSELERHADYVVEHLEDMPEVRDWSFADTAL